MSEEEGEGGPAELIHRVSEQTTYLLDKLKNKVDDDEVNSKAAVEEHLCNTYEWAVPHLALQEKVTSQLRGIINPLTPEFDPTCEPISAETIPDLAKESKTKIVILEFFTQCCINCIHSIEELRAALHGVKNEVRDSAVPGKCEIKLISVHSPKFTREKSSEAVRDFVDRMKMDHADVVNDPEMTLWSALGICCWPTILIFGPNPNPSSGASLGPSPLNLIYALKGEGHGAELKSLLQISLDYFNKQFQFEATDVDFSQPSPKALTEESLGTKSILKYPGKVAFYGNMLAIADSGNNRILISSSEGSVQEIIGGTGRRLEDGDFRAARFYNPQGIVFQDTHTLFVADTGNHAVRRVDLQTKQVTTWIQPNQRPTIIEINDEPAPQLKSPWDIVFYGPDVLLVAAAGSHQIFGYFFDAVKLFGREHAKNTFDLIAGTGKEENRNNSYILKSAFAQPSGICVSPPGISAEDKIIYIADSESSSIRSINSAGKVMALVGGNRDPCNLFTYGDQDGCGYDVRLQHPVGVCSSQDHSKIFIADTYNNKIKVIEVGTKRCTTLIGDGLPGNRVGGFADRSSTGIAEEVPSFNEPGGLSLDIKNQLLYIADTNNHCIKVADLVNCNVSILELNMDTVDSNEVQPRTTNSSEFDYVFNCEIPCSKSGFSVLLNIPNMGPKLDGVRWKVESSTNLTIGVDQNELEPEAMWRMDGIEVNDIKYVDQSLPAEFSIRADFFFCASNVCSREMKRFKFIFPAPTEDVEFLYPIYYEYNYPGQTNYDIISDFQAASAS